MLEAIIGLVGVLVGAGITTGYQHWRELKSQKARKRLALRELFDELGWYRVALARVLEDGDLSRLKRDAGPLDELWRQSREDLLTMDEARWQVLRKAVRTVTRTAEIASDVEPMTPTDPTVALVVMELDRAADAICAELGMSRPALSKTLNEPSPTTS